LKTFFSSYALKSCLFGWLFLLPFFAVASVSEALKDTIIIDGKILVVEQDVSYDTLNHQASRKKPRKTHNGWRLGWEFEGGSSLSYVNTPFEGYKTVNEYTGRITRYAPASGFSVLAEKEFPSWTLRFGFGLDSWIAPVRSFDVNQIDDSLYRFFSPEVNHLAQIVRYRYELGEELDTIPIQLSEQTFNSTNLHVRCTASKELKKTKTSFYRIGAGMEAVFALSQKRPDFILLANKGSKYFTPEANNTYRTAKWLIIPKFELGYRFKIQNKYWFDLGVYGKLLYRPIKREDAPIQIFGSTFGVSLAVILH
jgi:hypothetical protein